jgi:hypothetical protein
VNAVFNISVVFGIGHFVFDKILNLLFGFGVGKIECLLGLFIGLLHHIKRLSVRADTDQDSYFVRVLKRGIDGVKTAGIKVSDETIKERGVPNQSSKPLFEAFILLVCDE